MHIAVFAENRDGVDLAGRIMAAPGAEEHVCSVITADVNGEVACRIVHEAALRLRVRRRVAGTAARMRGNGCDD